MKLSPRLVMVIVIGIIVFFLCRCGSGGSNSTSPSVPRSSPTPAWYEGGTLHNATVAEWSSATNRNRLATAADWVTVTVHPEDLQQTRQIAQEVVTCVNGTVDVSPEEMKASELGLSCLILMGYTGQ